MGFIQRITDFFGRGPDAEHERSSTWKSEFGPGFDSWGLIVSNRNTPRNYQLRSPFSQHPWASGAIRLAGGMLGMIPFRIVMEDTEAIENMRTVILRGTPDEIHDAEFRMSVMLRRSIRGAAHIRSADVPTIAVPNSPWQKLFDRPSKRHGLSREELFSGSFMHAMQDGAVLMVFLGGPKGMIPEGQMPTGIDLYKVSEAKFRKDKRVWELRRDGRLVTVGEHQVVVLRVFSPDSRAGVTPLKAAHESMQQDLLAQGWNRAFFENGAEPGTVLTTDNPKLKVEDADALARAFDDRHQGVGKAKRTAVLGGGLKMGSKPPTHRDMGYERQFRMNREAVLAVLNVHKAALGVTDQLNRATIKEARRMIWSNVLLPWGAYIEGRLFAHLFEPFEQGKVWGVFDTSGVDELAEDLDTKADTLGKFTTAGVPLNDAAQLLGIPLPHYEWGDVGRLPSTLVDVGAPPAEVDDDDDDAPTDDDKAADATARSALAGTIAESLSDNERANRWWRAVGDSTERKFDAIVRRWLLEARQETLSNLDDATRATTLPVAAVQDVLFDLDRFSELLIGRTTDTYGRALSTSAADLIEELQRAGIDTPWDDADGFLERQDAAVNAWVRTKDLRLHNVTKHARNEIKRAIMAGIARGEGTNDIARRIRETSNRQMSRGRTRRIARTETASAANNVREIGFDAVGVESIRWIAASDARDTHVLFAQASGQAEADGVPFARGFNFGDLVGGQYTIRHPHDQVAPASEVVNCRCVMVAVAPPPPVQE